jgi:tripartite-type tricarboxylate transporter receptor subunit TctC
MGYKNTGESRQRWTFIRRFVVLMITAGLMFLYADVVSGQNYPNRPIRMLTTEVGGGADFVARVVAHGLSGVLGQQVIVDNRGGGLIAGEIVARAPRDGYTLLLQGSAFLLAPFLRSSVPYDPVRDFAPITLADSAPSVLVVHPSLPVKSVKELIALAKAKPGELNYAAGSIGATPHLSAELFNTMAGVNITRINYRGTGPALNDLIGGQVQLMFTTPAAGLPHVKSGRLRALAVTSAQPSPLAPGLPTVTASGLPGYESVSIHGIFAPAGTPATIINKLNQEIARVLNRSDVKEKMFKAGIEPVGSLPEEFAATVKSQMATWGKLIKDTGIREE